jgi:branched-chain amino acid transport system ATP-binding protein
MLEVDSIETFYGQSQVLFGMSLAVGAGEVVTLMGRNGMGKTTTIRSIMGLVPARKGRIVLDGVEITRMPSYGIAQRGLGLVPEGRMIFPNLTVQENLIAAAANYGRRADPWTLDKVLHLFPSLAERRRNMGNQLSGGEQQMLAIGRALMINPSLLILDEATEGLAPLIRDEIWRILGEVKRTGQSILVVDKNIDALARIAERHYIIEKGQVVWTGTSGELRSNAELAHRYLGI